MKKTIGYVLNVLFIILVAYLTIDILFKDQEFSTIIADLDRANKLWLALGLVLSFFFVAGESVIIKYMLRMFKVKIPLLRCIKYSFVGFFYSYITPSSSGGQPAQMYYMKKDGIKFGHSTLIMLIIAIAYKAVLVVGGVIFLLFEYDFIVENVGNKMWLVIVGFILNIIYISGLVVLFFNPLGARKVAVKGINFLCKIKVLKRRKYDAYIARIDRLKDTYIEGANYVKTHIRAVVNIFIMTCIQRGCLFAVTWVVYKSYGLSGTSFIGIITLQTILAVAVEMLPLPGAAGITEACFIVMFSGIFGDELVKSGMLLSRGLTFYCVLIAGAVVTFIAHFIAMREPSLAAPEVQSVKPEENSKTDNASLTEKEEGVLKE